MYVFFYNLNICYATLDCLTVPFTLSVSWRYSRALFLSINPSDAEVTFVQCTKSKDKYENHLNPAMLIFFGKLSLSTIR